MLHWYLSLKKNANTVHLYKCASRTTDSLYTPYKYQTCLCYERWCFSAVSLSFSPWSNWCLYSTRDTHYDYCCLRQLVHCCFSTFHCCVLWCEVVSQWVLAAFPLHAVHWWFSLLTSPYRSCHPAVICLLWMSSPVVLCYNVHRLIA